MHGYLWQSLRLLAYDTGTLDGRRVTEPTSSVAETHAMVVCEPAWWLAPQTRDDCAHAAGHGFFYYHLDIGKAVESCWTDQIVDHTPCGSLPARPPDGAGVDCRDVQPDGVQLNRVWGYQPVPLNQVWGYHPRPDQPGPLDHVRRLQEVDPPAAGAVVDEAGVDDEGVDGGGCWECKRVDANGPKNSSNPCTQYGVPEGSISCEGRQGGDQDKDTDARSSGLNPKDLLKWRCNPHPHPNPADVATPPSPSPYPHPDPEDS